MRIERLANPSRFLAGIEVYLDLGHELSRPFVCHGVPAKCGIFIVGYNPARTLRRPFRHYWNDDRGFDKCQWRTDFYEQNANPVTRRVIEKIANVAGQENVLDTNIYWYPTAKKTDLKRKNRISNGFEFLMNELTPSIVFAYSKRPIEFFGVDFLSLPRKQLLGVPGDWNGAPFRLFCWRDHLRSTSYEDAERIGQELRDALLTGASQK